MHVGEPQHGPGHAPGPIDVFGSGFATATGVVFSSAAGSATVTPTVLSDSHLTATPPAHTAPFTACTDSANVSVTATGGTSAPIGAPGQFTYYQLPTVTSVTPATGSASSPPTGVIVAGTCFVDVSAVTFTPVGGGTAVPAVSVTVTSPGTLTLDAPSGLTAGTTYDIQVTTTGGTSAAVAADQFAVTV